MRKKKDEEDADVKRTEAGKRIGRVIGWIGAALAVGLAAVLGLPGVFGVRVMTVQSGSMEPELPVGSLVIVRECGANEVREGDIISFRRKDMVVTHRVTAVEEAGRFRTKGDANEEEDSGSVMPGELIGKAVGCVPGLGYAAVCLQDPRIRAGLLLAGALLFLIRKTLLARERRS